jgi:hypothetical protein
MTRLVDVQALAVALNAVDWADLGFVCDGRFLFTQRSLEQTPLPESFRAFLPDCGVRSQPAEASLSSPPQVLPPSIPRPRPVPKGRRKAHGSTPHDGL